MSDLLSNEEIKRRALLCIKQSIDRRLLPQELVDVLTNFVSFFMRI